MLVVDDDDRMRNAAVKLLNHLGFDTLQARDGLEALGLVEQHGGRIQLILMDLSMPRMNGEEAYRELRQRGILVPVILSSGFQETEALRRFRGQGLAGFLQKPYKHSVLVKMLRETLGTGPGWQGNDPGWSDRSRTGVENASQPGSRVPQSS